MGRNIRGTYPPEWKAIAKAVKDSAGWRCVRCGHAHERPWKGRRRNQSGRVECDDECDLHYHPEWRQADVIRFSRIATRKRHSSVWMTMESSRREVDGIKWVRVQEPPQRVLTTAHLDDDKSNCRWWNLAALCQVCHLQTQSRIEMDRPWVMTAHSVWFQPYVAGFYAFKYLGEDLSQVEVAERLPELLELEKKAHGMGKKGGRR